MRLFGRKAAAGAVRPALVRSMLSAIGTAEWPRSYEAQVRDAYLGNAVAQRAVRMVAEACGGVPLYATADGHAAETLLRGTVAGQGLFETVASQLLLHGKHWPGWTSRYMPRFSLPNRASRRRTLKWAVAGSFQP